MLVETFTKLGELDPECNWGVTTLWVCTAAEQLAAVENFITAGMDAICVIQNNADTTSECIAKAKEAGVRASACARLFAGEQREDAAGSCCYDFVLSGIYAGQDALSRGIKKSS